jgi:hypothetical protein
MFFVSPRLLSTLIMFSSLLWMCRLAYAFGTVN